MNNLDREPKYKTITCNKEDLFKYSNQTNHNNI